jgi:hypothetical protein
VAHVSADLASYQLVAYGRFGPIRPALTGKLTVHGRKPWLGLVSAGAWWSPEPTDGGSGGHDRVVAAHRAGGAGACSAVGMACLPPRLPEQPVFYPVLDEDYAVRIARGWNVPRHGSGM